MDDFPDDHDLLMNIATQGLVPIEHGLSGQADYDSCDFFDEILSQVSLPDTDKPKGETRFANPVSDQQVQEAQLKAIPANTKKCTNWAVNVWKAWSTHRRSTNSLRCPSHLLIMANNKWELNYWMTRFVMEVRRKDGQEYPPNTLHQICCGILRYVREITPEMDFFKDPAFSELQKTLDSEMKRLRSRGLGCNPKKADPISVEEEELLWSTGALGESSPQTLVDTMVYMCGLFFALRSGSEHRQLRMDNIKLFEKPGDSEVPYLVYTECVSKNHQGGLKHRKLKPKRVVHHANTENPSRCFVRLYKLYLELRPEGKDDDPFYLTPIPKPQFRVWFKKSAIGIHTLDGTIARMCKKAGLGGFKTNHSLRVTTATRLYQEGLDEQLIMERTGHRSLDGVREYKRTSREQQELVSAALNGNQMKRPKISGKNITKAIDLTRKEPLSVIPSLSNKDDDVLVVSPQKSSGIVCHPSIHSTKENFVCIGPRKEDISLSVSKCSGITINYNFHSNH